MLTEVKKISPAKINLYLEVQGKTDDGYHELESLMTFCDIGDVIHIKKSNSFSLKLSGPFSKDLKVQNNIIIKAVNLAETILNKKINVRINLIKNLPISSGMGGGSSNAATTILCLNEIYKFPKIENFNNLLFSLGADVPFCFSRKTSLVSGKGQILKKVDKIPEFLVLLVNPLIEVSTQRIFSRLKKTKNKKLEYDENAMKSDNILIFLNQKKNDLEEQAKLICKNISQILDYLKIETNSKLTRMTGSGATCFAIYDNVKDLNNAESLMKKKFKNFWVKKTKICNKI